MNSWAIETMRRIYAEASEGLVMEDGLIRYDRPGHTRQIAHLPYCHEGRYSAGYYAMGRLLSQIGQVEKSGAAVGETNGFVRSEWAAHEGAPYAWKSKEQASSAWESGGSGEFDARGAQTLRALADLQIRDPEAEHYGAFRWYAEEAQVQDSNAAFFILMPLVSLRLRAPDALPPEHTKILNEMLVHAAAWFERECQEPELYYPNKTMSDGAMLLAIAHLLEDGERLKVAADYFDRWESYTTRRGWGWGENMSLVYQGVMLNALEIAAPLLQDLRPALAQRLEEHREALLDLLRFHDGRELVPSIRSYNFGGEAKRSSLAWLIAGVTGTQEVGETAFHVNDFATLLLFESKFQDGTRSRTNLPLPRVRQEHVYDNASAYSWIGRRMRLGSLNVFPVMPGSYQHETWGLGWQSFPLSAAAEDGRVSYARWSVHDGGTIRTHPAESYKTAYLMPALFREPPYPEVRTYAAQNHHALLALRVLEHVNQPVAEIADEWLVPGYEGEAAEIPGGDGRLWRILSYPGAALAITPLEGIRMVGGSSVEEETLRPERIPGILHAEYEEERLKLRQLLYTGEKRRLRAARLEAGWAVLCLDEAADEAAVRARLAQVEILDETLDDREVPREPHERIRYVRLLETGREQVSLRLDPHLSVQFRTQAEGDES
ncbi:hypothetical protein B9G55_16555 [Saccharibacillus sp. O16]|nr:hypothetical protein B9G55_16555 [Saccharibacillus sp. O16]